MSIRIVMPGMLYYVFLSPGSGGEAARPLVRHVWNLEPNLVPEFPVVGVNDENFLHGIPSADVNTILRTDQRNTPSDVIFSWQASQYHDVVTCILTVAPNLADDTSDRWLTLWNSQKPVLSDAGLAQAREVGEGFLGDAIVFFGQVDDADFVAGSLAAANILLQSLIGPNVDPIGREQLHVSSPGISLVRIQNVKRRQILLVLVWNHVPDAEVRLLSPLIFNGYNTEPPALVAYLNASVKVLYEADVGRQRHETLVALHREQSAERASHLQRGSLLQEETRRKLESMVHRRNELFGGYRRVRLTVEAAIANMRLFRLPPERFEPLMHDSRPPWEIGATFFTEDDRAAVRQVKQIDADLQRLETVSSVFDEWRTAESRDLDERIKAEAIHSEELHAYTERLLALIGVAFTGTTIVDSILGNDERKPAYMFCVTAPLLVLAYFGVDRIQYGRAEATWRCLVDELIVAGCIGYLVYLLWPAARALAATLDWQLSALVPSAVLIVAVLAWQFARGKWRKTG